MTELMQPVLDKGLNLIAAIDALPEGATPDCGNVEFGAGGIVETRGGSAVASLTLPTAAGASRDMYVMEEEGFPFLTSPSTPNANVAQLMCTGGRIYRTENTPGGTTGIIDIGAYTVKAGVTVAPRPYGVHYTDALTGAAVSLYNIIAFADSAPLAIISGSLAVPTAVAHADWTVGNGYPVTLAAYGGRMWYAGSDKFPGRLWVTDVGKFGTFTVTAPVNPAESFVLDLELTNGGRILGIKHLFDLLLIFTTRGVYRIVAQTGTVPYKSVFVSNLVAVSQHALVQVDSSIHFLVRSGAFTALTALTYGDIKSEEISPAIAPLFEATEAWRLSGAFGVYDDTTEKLRFFMEHEYPFGHVSTVTPIVTQAQAIAQMDLGNRVYPPEVTECLSYDIRGKSWARDFFNIPIDFAVARDEGTGTIALEAYNRTSTTNVNEYGIYTPGLTTDGTAVITGYFRTKRDSFKSLNRRKEKFFVYSRISTGAPTVNASVDGAAFVATQGASAIIGNNRHSVVGSGMDVQMEFISTAPFRLDSFSADVKAGGKR